MNSELLDRLPPQNLDAEKGVIGSLLLAPAVCDRVADVLAPSDFYADAHRKLFEHIMAMRDGGSPVDPMLLLERLRAAGDLEAIGGRAALAEIAQAVPYAANAVYYARIVRDKAKLRKLIHGLTETLRDAYAPHADADELVTRAENDLGTIATGDTAGGPSTMLDATAEALSQVDAVMRRERSAGLLTGLESLDAFSGGLFPSELIILAARPNIGKSALALQIAAHVAERGRHVAYFSLEMRRTELSMRLLCGASGVDNRRVRSGTIGHEECKRLNAAAKVVASPLLHVDDRPRRTVLDVARTARHLHRTAPLALFVLDYLTLLQPADTKPPRHEQIAAMTGALKLLARELDLPVLCLAQLNRETERQDRPGLHNLRESGAIEQDADVVMFIHRENAGFRDKGGADRAAELLIAKHRAGPCGAIKLTWEPERTRFSCEASAPAASNGFADDFDRFA